MSSSIQVRQRPTVARGRSAELDLRFRSLWSAFRHESPAFMILLVYVAWEYWRLHQVWPVLNVVPWGQLWIGACVAAFFLTGERGRRSQGMDALLIAYMAWLFITIPLGVAPEAALREWASPASWLFLYFLVSYIVVTPRRLLLFWLAMMVVHFKMSQHGALSFVSRGFSFDMYGLTGSPGWFQDSGEFAMAMAMFIPLSWGLLLAIRPHVSKVVFGLGVVLFPTTALLSVLGSSVRGAQMATLVVILLLVGASRVSWKGVVVAGVALVVGWQMLPQLQKDRFSSIGTEEDESGEARLVYWQAGLELVSQRPIFGVGYEGWAPYYRNTGAPRVQAIHNTYLEAATELGIPGLLMFLGLIGGSFLNNRKTRRQARRLGVWGKVFGHLARGLDLALIALMICSFFMSVLYWPVYWMTFAMAVSLSATTRRMYEAQRRRAVVASPSPGVSWPLPEPSPRPV